MAEKAVFIDRDGTLIRDKNYLSDPDKIEWYPGVFEALRKLARAGFRLVVVTNQSGVARGYFGEETVREVNNRLEEELGREGIELEDIYYCPAHPEAEAEKYRQNLHRRKPAPGMLKEACCEHGLSPGESFMVGDKPSDVECGKRAGCRSILVETGKEKESGQQLEFQPDYVATDFKDAARWIVESAREETG